MLEKWLAPIIDYKKLWQSIGGYAHYMRDWRRYEALAGVDALHVQDAYPRLHDQTSYTSFDAHYFYQDLWALKSIQRTHTLLHVDIGSNATYVGMLTAITRVLFLDIRPLDTHIENLTPLDASILDMPFADHSLGSVSCLHVAEHIGLGRYGDPIDPEGTRKAALELARVLKPGGHLYLSLPIGRARVCFNAHRVHTTEQIISYFSDLQLLDFAAVTDDGHFQAMAQPAELSHSDYACGMFHFTRTA